MTFPFSRVLITGGAGFIGSNLVAELIRSGSRKVLTYDALTYAGNLDSLAAVMPSADHVFVHADITDGARFSSVLEEFRPDAVLHLAAESHVDRSIENPAAFIQTNVVGTSILLEASYAYWRRVHGGASNAFRFLHVSTDEVFGSLGEQGLFREDTPYAPNSPYSASKAASDHLVRAYHHTYGLPTLTTNCSNNYGPFQFPEKLIPLVLQRALDGKSLPIYGDGLNIRDWLFVGDHCRALLAVLENGTPGETYNIGGRNEKTNIEVVQVICRLLDKKLPSKSGKPYESQIEYVADRPGHDRRYAMDAGKMQRELAWLPVESFETGMEKTVDWYLANQAWCGRILSGAYKLSRLGLPEAG